MMTFVLIIFHLINLFKLIFESISVLRGPDPLNLPLKRVYHATGTKIPYNLLGYNCHHYANQMYHKLLFTAQTFHKDKRDKDNV